MKTYINKFSHPAYALLAPVLITLAVLGLSYIALKVLLFISQFTPIF